jgi:hypothetical protein
MLKAKNCYRRPEARVGNKFEMLRGMLDGIKRYGYQYDAQDVKIRTLNNFVAELKRLKGELEDAPEKNET